MNAVVIEARRWIGTPYVHQAAVRGGGCDCLGLVRGVWQALYGAPPVNVPAYTADWSEPQQHEVLWQAAKTYLLDVSDQPQAPGQVLLFRMRTGSVAKHLGILAQTDRPTFIHAYAGHGVTESPLSRPWARRVVARFTFEESDH